MDASNVHFAKVNAAKAEVLTKALALVVKAKDWITKREAVLAELNKKAGGDEASLIQTRDNKSKAIAHEKLLTEVNIALDQFKRAIREGNRPGGDTQIYYCFYNLERLFSDYNIFNADARELVLILRNAQKKVYIDAMGVPVSNSTRDWYRLRYLVIEAFTAVGLAMAILFPWVGGVPLLAFAIPVFVMTQLTMTLPVLIDDASHTRRLVGPDFSLQDRDNLPVMAWDKINAVLGEETTAVKGKPSEGGLFKRRDDLLMAEVQTLQVVGDAPTEGLPVAVATAV